MKTSNFFKSSTILVFLFIVVISSTSFTYNSRSISGPKDPVRFVYSFNVGKPVTYFSSTVVIQAMDINGQTVNVQVNNDLAYTVKFEGKAGDNLKLLITIDSLTTKTESMQGSTGGKIKDVGGKSFNLILSPSGKIIDASEAEKIEYSADGTQKSSMLQFFSHNFPEVPEKQVSIGDTWIKNDTLRAKTSTSITTQIVTSTNKFDGIEKINGVDCAKITSSITGNMQATVQNNGMDIFMNGPLQGNVTIFFALTEGYLVKQDVSSKVNGNIEITGAQNMTFPMVMETNSKVVTGN
jgi:hypothetical protein